METETKQPPEAIKLSGKIREIYPITETLPCPPELNASLVSDVSDTVHGFHFRLRDLKTGAATGWAGYEMAILFGEVVAVTPYYADIGKITFLSPLGFCQLACLEFKLK